MPAGPGRINGDHDDGTDRYDTSSKNWSGQIDVGTTFTAVVGKWTVPAVVASTSPKYVANWIGIGGDGITELIQTGTTSMTSGSSTTYSAWYELLPSTAIRIREPVSPGDAMVAEIEETSSDRWYIGIEDATKGWTATGTVTYTAGPANSAEWITERPTVTGGLSTLADFGSVRFHDLRVDGADVTTTNLTAAYMYTSREIIAYPGEITGTTTANFTDYYGAPATSTPSAPRTTPPRTTPPRTTTPPRSAPTITGVVPSSGPVGGGTEVTITGTDLTDASNVYFGLTRAASFRVTSSTRITTTSPAGTGTVNVTVATPGGTSAVASSGQFTYLAAPTVSSVSPAAGPASGGTEVTITGTDLTDASNVYFGLTRAASFRVTSSTRITTTSPAGTGTVDVTVATPGGTSAVTSSAPFTYLAIPTVSSVIPVAGPASAGTVVTITGTNYVDGATVRFGTTSATRVTVVNSTRITAVSPSSAAGSVNVTVTTSGGTSVLSSADRFRYLAAPRVTSVSLHEGPLRGRTVVTITGTNFVDGATVRFGTKPATQVSVVNSTRITAMSPAGNAGSVNVTVTTSGGTSVLSSADLFRYLILKERAG